LVAVAEGSSIQRNNLALVERAGRISLYQIPSLLLFLAACLTEASAKMNEREE
jgi:hypothetical protein